MYVAISQSDLELHFLLYFIFYYIKINYIYNDNIININYSLKTKAFLFLKYSKPQISGAIFQLELITKFNLKV